MFSFGVVATIPELLEVVCVARKLAFGTSGALEHLVLCLIGQGDAPGAAAVAITANEPSAPSAAPIKSKASSRDDPYAWLRCATMQSRDAIRQYNEVVASAKKPGAKG